MGQRGGHRLPGVSPVAAEQDVALVLGTPRLPCPGHLGMELSLLGTQHRGRASPEPTQVTFRSKGSIARFPESRLACGDHVARRGAASEEARVLRESRRAPPLLCFCGMPLVPRLQGQPSGEDGGVGGQEAQEERQMQTWGGGSALWRPKTPTLFPSLC